MLFDVHRADLTVLIFHSVAADAQPVGAHRGEQIVVPAEQQRRTVRHSFQQLELRLEDVFPAAEHFNVRNTDRGDDPDRRPDGKGEVADFPEAAHSHLDDGGLVAGSEVEEGVRNADLVVLVALIFQSVVFCGKYCMDEFLGGGLADTAGHPDKRDLEPAAVGAADFDQRPLSVGDEDAAGGVGTRHAAFHHRGLGSVCKRLSGKVVPVERIATKTVPAQALRESVTTERTGASKLTLLPTAPAISESLICSTLFVLRLF